MRQYPTSNLVVDRPEIVEALDLETGDIPSVWDLVGNDYEKALQLRMALRQGIAAGSPLLVCPLCLVPVHLVSLPQDTGQHRTSASTVTSRSMNESSFRCQSFNMLGGAV